MRHAAPLVCLMAAGCFNPTLDAEYELEDSPFATPYVARDAARLEIELLDGYTCPDDTSPRVYRLTPVGAATPRPLAVLLHGENFDYVEEGPQGDNFASEDRLNGAWAFRTVEEMIGLRAPAAGMDADGAWAGALLDAGFSVVAPTGCWGDLWHGTGRSAWGDEGFLRMGAYFLDDVVTREQGREDVDADRTLMIGLGEGGRGVVEMLRGAPGTTLVAPAALVIDSSPDWLARLLAAPAQNRARLEGLERIYESELSDDLEQTERYQELELALERDSLATLVREGLRTPVYYAMSSLDERIAPAESLPALEAIAAVYPESDHRVVDWGVRGHAPSNRDRTQAGLILDWVSTHLP